MSKDWADLSTVVEAEEVLGEMDVVVEMVLVVQAAVQWLTCLKTGEEQRRIVVAPRAFVTVQATQ